MKVHFPDCTGNAELLAPTPTQVADLWRLSALVIAFPLMQIPGYPHFGAPRPGGFVIRKTQE